MSAYLIVDVDIHDPEKYKLYQAAVRPALEAIGVRYLARGGAFKVLEGDWQPHRMVLLEFPSQAVLDAFYFSPAYEAMKAIRQEASVGRLISLEGME